MGRGGTRSWFHADFLLDKGFEVIITPAMRWGGDHAFASRIGNLSNVAVACSRLKRAPRPMGILISSWALRLNHLETQWPGFAIPMLACSHDADSWQEVKGKMSRLAFGKELPEFFDAWEKIGATLFFAESKWGVEEMTWHYGQSDTIPFMLEKLRRDENEWFQKQVNHLDDLKKGYRRGQDILAAMGREVVPGNRCLRFWQMAARAIIHKADTLDLFMNTMDGKIDKTEVVQLLLAEEELRDDYKSLLWESYTPASVEREACMIFGSSLRHLMRLAQDNWQYYV